MSISIAKSFICCVLGLFLLQPVSAQTENDSLWNIWMDETNLDTVRLEALQKYNWNNYVFTNQDSALSIAQLQFDFARKKGLEDYTARAIRYKGIASYYNGDLIGAIAYYNKAFTIDSLNSNKKAMAASLMNLGLVYSNQGDFVKSIDYYLRGLKISEKLNDSLAMAASLTNIGGLYFHQGNAEDAQRYFQKGHNIYEALSDEGGMSMTLINLGLMLQGQGKYTEAEQHYLKCLEISRRTNMKLRMVEAYDNLGTLYLDIGENDKALEAYENSLTTAKESNNMSGTAAALGGLATVFLKMNDVENAKENAVQAFDLSNQMEVSLDLKGNIATLLYEVYKAEGNTERALELYEQSVAFRDSLKNEESQQEVMRQHFKYETEKKEQEIALLNAEKDRREAQRNLFVGLSIAAAILLLVGGYFIVRIRRQNKVIEIALEEKNVLLKEIHHRVKNNLQMISSLLGLQSRYTSDETASKALKESQGRVTSVSLIHQRLYSETNLTGVYMPEYVQELTEELLYSANAEETKVNLNIEDLTLDIDTVIPIGLIFNELITNSIKYGKVKGREELTIELYQKADIMMLRVMDNGPGFSKEFNPSTTSSYGMKLIRSLSDKLRAESRFENREDGGAVVELRIRKYKHA